MNPLRYQVISAFRKLHRAREAVFAGDTAALNAARAKINEGFKKNKAVTSEESIKELINFSEECSEVLSKTVLQAREIEPGRYALRISRDTHMWDNVPFREDAVLKPASASGCGGGGSKQ